MTPMTTVKLLLLGLTFAAGLSANAQEPYPDAQPDEVAPSDIAETLTLQDLTLQEVGDNARSAALPENAACGNVAVVGAGIGGYVGHEGTDANGHVSTSNTSDSTVRRAQAALNDRGYNVGAVDGRFAPNTQSAVRRFQAKSGLTESGTLDSSTRNALGVNS